MTYIHIVLDFRETGVLSPRLLRNSRNQGKYMKKVALN